jgi:glucan biosynthesis protein C
MISRFTASPDSPTALDYLRGLAALGVIVAHASMAYMQQFPPCILWPVLEPRDSSFPDLWFLYGRSVGVPVLFAISGFHAALALKGRNPGAFALRRLRRFGWPFVLGVLFVLPLLYPIWAYGAWMREYVTFEQIIDFRLSTQDKQAILGPAHLWFLEHVLILSLLLALAVRIFPSLCDPAQSRIHPVALMLGPPSIVIVTGLAIRFDPATIHDFTNSFLPSPWVLAYNASFFFAGFCIGRYALLRDYLGRTGLPLWVLGHLLFAVWMHLTWSGRWASSADANGNFESVCAALTGVICTAAWLGLAFRAAPLPDLVASPLRRLARAAFDLYVFHLPAVWLAQVLMYQAPLSTPTRIAVATLAGLASGFAAHMVRVYLRRRASLARRSISDSSFSAPRSVGR